MKKGKPDDTSLYGQKDQMTYEVIQVPKTTGVRFFTSVDPGSYIPKHWHHALEIIYMQEGELTVMSGAAVRQLHAGECILINTGEIHSTKCTAPNKAVVFQIPMEFMQQYIPDVQQLHFSLDEPTDNPVRNTKLTIFKETLTQMQIANDIRPEGFVLRFNSLLFEIMFQLYHNFSVRVFRANRNQKDRDMARLNRVLEYTAKYYNQPISIEEIAGVAYLQAEYFCRFFKKCMGITYLEYQNELRLSHIYQDLITTEDTIQEILERHGFSNYKLFRRVFYQHFNGTPTEVRANRRKC
ncbi:MAG: AraC family transcriptional regulator [Eubacteriales bacterium]|nr:AraC family transcriptional regulator [Eubacteriales bacterium]